MSVQVINVEWGDKVTHLIIKLIALLWVLASGWLDAIEVDDAIKIVILIIKLLWNHVEGIKHFWIHN